jgi:hypothetical protein
MIDLRELRLRAGQRLSGRNFPPLWRKLLSAIAERTPKRIVGARQRRGPDGVNMTATAGGGGGYLVHPWQMSVDESDEMWRVRFRRGLVNGVEAKIGDKLMSEEDSEGELPALEVREFDARGIARIHVCVKFEGFAWFTKSVELITTTDLPEPKLFTAHKLIGILVKDEAGDVQPEARAFFDLRILPVDRTKDGAALYLTGPSA